MSKIAFIDTGFTLPDEMSGVWFSKGVGIAKSCRGVCRFTSDSLDFNGHGTLVGLLLAAFCQDSYLVPVRIAQVQNTCSIPFVSEDVLALGIDWCIEQKIRLINISYSIEKIANNGPLVRVCNKAIVNNCILVASYRNGSQLPVYPASFSSVIGVSVGKELDDAQIIILSKKNYDVAAFGGPFRMTHKDGKSIFFGGTSMATVQVTSMIARILKLKPWLSVRQVFRYLIKYASK
ncbi:MAG: S8 family serine peptidase [Bacteroidales bacterium]|jgi:minor extracellular protease Epr|nr:S8 family serine peptidase [Bacteroidales bacterium]